jgi:hypothetical protein
MDVIHIGVNKAFAFDKLALDYLFMQDYPAVKGYIERANNYLPGMCRKFYGIISDLSFEANTCIPNHEADKADALRYYTGHPITPFYEDIASMPLPNFNSVVFSALSLAFYTNPRKIFLVGCDVTLSQGYFDNSKSLLSNDTLFHISENIRLGWRNAKAFAGRCYPETEVISINPVGLKGMFEDRYTQEYLDDHPEIDGELV